MLQQMPSLGCFLNFENPEPGILKKAFLTSARYFVKYMVLESQLWCLLDGV